MASEVVCNMNIKGSRVIGEAEWNFSLPNSLFGVLHPKSFFNKGGILLAQGRFLTLQHSAYSHFPVNSLFCSKRPNPQSLQNPTQVDWLLVTRLPSKYVIISRSCDVNPYIVWFEKNIEHDQNGLSKDMFKDIVKGGRNHILRNILMLCPKS